MGLKYLVRGTKGVEEFDGPERTAAHIAWQYNLNVYDADRMLKYIQELGPGVQLIDYVHEFSVDCWEAR